jgi:hypothetical protein
MSQNFIFKSSFHALIITIDREMAAIVMDNGCDHCGGKLHQAHYPRSPVGMPADFRDHYNQRISFCCSSCRKRTTPASVRFFGRRRSPAPIFMLICILQCGINERRLSQIKRHFGITVSESTWKRWRRWWRESFEETKFWMKEKGLLSTPPSTNQLIPRALFTLFTGNFTEKICFLLRFLSPLTGGVFRSV